MRQASARERAQAKRALRRLAMLVLLLLFSAILCAVTLPWAAEGALCRSFGQGLQAKTVAADVKAAPFWKLFAGKTDSMELWLEFDDASLISLTQLRARWGSSNVALSLMRRGEGSARDAEPTETELTWDEARLAAYLNRVQGEVLVSRVEIRAEDVSIYGSIDLAGAKHNVFLSGTPHTNDLGQVVFTADECRAEGLALTEQLCESLSAALSFEPDLSPLYWKVWAKQVVLEEGKMTVYGGSSCCH